jgi:hypothetical protein
MKKLIVSPQSGFGNRLRALCSAKVFGDRLGRKVLHYWVEDPHMAHLSHINDMKRITPSYIFDLDIPLFVGERVDVCFTEWLPGDFWYESQSTAQQRLPCAGIRRAADIGEITTCEEEIILVETSHALKPAQDDALWNAMMTDVYKRHFRLNPRWAKLYDSLPSFDFGVHIRRGDFIEYYPDSDIDPATVRSIVGKCDGITVIFSDDRNFLFELRKTMQCPFGIAEEESGLSGPDVYIAQFLALSKCRKVIGTQGSSFSEQAALFGGVDYEPIPWRQPAPQE